MRIAAPSRFERVPINQTLATCQVLVRGERFELVLSLGKSQVPSHSASLPKLLYVGAHRGTRTLTLLGGCF